MTCLVAAMNPCPCGMLGHPRRACRCAPSAVTRYRNRISGPLLERIDLVNEVPVESKHVSGLWKDSPLSSESTEIARARDVAVREFASHSGRPQAANSKLPGNSLRQHMQLAPQAERLLTDAAKRWSLSARAVHRTLRVGRTIADLSARETISQVSMPRHLASAARRSG